MKCWGPLRNFPSGVNNTPEGRTSIFQQLALTPRPDGNDCQFECGATSVKIERQVKGVSYGNVTFEIGNGTRFQRKKDECLAACYVVPRKVRSCRDIYTSYRKVSTTDVQATNLKLCCVEKKCVYDSKNDSWKMHKRSD